MENTHLDPGRGTPARPPSVPNAKPTGDAADPPPELRALGEFRILRRLGKGGMGAVYLAYEGRRERPFALKVLNDDMAGNQGYVDRFYREAKSGALLNHPNIVRTHNAGQDRATGKHYLVLEYVDGPSAQAILAQQGKLSVGDAVHVALDIARALEHAHSRNIVHRDIKPDNILITRSGVAKLGDLGLAKRTDEASHLTAARQGFGTTYYMPYEQAISAKYADARSDIYALGATLYHLLTGQVPFPGDNHLEVVERKNQGLYQPASWLNPDVPPVLDQMLGRMMARQPRDRYQTASELIIDLERSRLAVPVPSFADPDLARNDPWVQAFTSPAEPTRLDLDRVGGQASQVTEEEEWIVHYRNRAGRPFATRLSTAEVLERLQEGTLPADAEARHPSEETARPLGEIDLFRDHLPPVEERPGTVRDANDEAEARAGVGTLIALLVSAVGLAAGLVMLVRWIG